MTGWTCPSGPVRRRTTGIWHRSRRATAGITRHADAGRFRTAEVDRLRRNLDPVSRQAENLQAALESNRRIGMAVGILVVSLDLTDEAAFDCLRHVSNRRTVELRLVAEEVIDEGALD